MMTQILLDDQNLSLPDVGDLDAILVSGKIGDFEAYTKSSENFLRSAVKITRNYPERARVAFARYKNLSDSFVPLLLYKVGERWQRVHIEQARCNKCGWSGVIANPGDESLYFGLSNHIAKLREAKKIASVGCPSCSSKLNRQAVWADKDGIFTEH